MLTCNPYLKEGDITIDLWPNYSAFTNLVDAVVIDCKDRSLWKLKLAKVLEALNPASLEGLFEIWSGFG